VLFGSNDGVGLLIEVVGCGTGTLSAEIKFQLRFQAVATAYLKESKNPLPFGLLYISKRVNSSFGYAPSSPIGCTSGS